MARPKTPSTKFLRAIAPWKPCRSGQRRVGKQRIDQWWRRSDTTSDMIWLLHKICLYGDIPEPTSPHPKTVCWAMRAADHQSPAQSLCISMLYRLSPNDLRGYTTEIVILWARRRALPRRQKGWR